MKTKWKNKDRQRKIRKEKAKKGETEETARQAYLQKIEKRFFKKCKWFATLFALKIMKQTKI